MRVYKGLIKNLTIDDIFVFGSNLQGFHGAGSAGYASFGVPGNQWRKFEYDKKSNGWKGRWNVKGIGEGLQEGKNGWSYALPTVTKAGAKRSLSKEQITFNINTFYSCCLDNSKFKFLVAYSGLNPNKTSYNGYSAREMSQMFNQQPMPDNVVFEYNFGKLIKGESK